MQRKTACLAISAFALFALPPAAGAAGLTPGLYEYTMKMNMPGAPEASNTPVQTMQYCITAKDVAAIQGYGAPLKGDSDCLVKDMVESGGQFSYKISCTKPQHLDAAVKGAVKGTNLTMDMIMSMPDGRGTMTQSTTAKRIGDCKQ